MDLPEKERSNTAILLVKSVGSCENTTSRPIALQHSLLFRWIEPLKTLPVVVDHAPRTVLGERADLGPRVAAIVGVFETPQRARRRRAVAEVCVNAVASRTSRWSTPAQRKQTRLVNQSNHRAVGARVYTALGILLTGPK